MRKSLTKAGLRGELCEHCNAPESEHSPDSKTCPTPGVSYTWSPITKQQRIDLRGVRNGYCNNLKCLSPKPTWLHKEHESFYCAGCASQYNRDEPGICVNKGHS